MPDNPLNRNNVGALHKDHPVEQPKARVYRPVLSTEAIAADRRRRQFLARFPEATYVPDLGCDEAHLLKCDLDLQLNHIDCWGAVGRTRLERIYKKVNYEQKSGEPGYWKRQREWKDYDSTATLIALSVYERADDFCSCGFNGYSCGNRLLCPRCCYKLLAEPALIEFGNSFTADQECYFIVMSLSGERDEKKRFIFKDLTKSEMQQIKLAGQYEQGSPANYGIPFSEPLDADDARLYFEMYAKVMHEFTGHRRGQIFSGAFGGPELAVRFLPLAALPHANYLAWSAGISNDDARRLRRALADKLRGSRRLRSGLYPKLAVYRIQSKHDYRAVIRYLFKPLDFGLAYQMVAESADCDPADLRELNTQLDYFFENLRVVMSDVRRMNRYGFCCPAAKAYIGHVSIDRKLRRRKDAARRQKRKKQEAEVCRKFPGYQPHKRRQSRRQKAEMLRMRLWYERYCEDGKLKAKPPRRWLRKTSLAPP